MENPGTRGIQLKQAIRLALFFCLIQVALLFLMAPKTDGVYGAYLKASQWDSFHYQDILDRGYQVPAGELTPTDVHSNRANAGFFPAYPILAKSIQAVSGVSSKTALIVTAQFFCFLFWLFLFLLLKMWRFSSNTAVLIGITLALYPASFFLVAAYSESLFLASLFGMILWTERWIEKTKMKKLSWDWVVAGAWGFTLSGTRLVGIPLVIYSVLRWISLGLEKKSVSDCIRAAGLSFLSGLGGIIFFIWSYFRFGQWDIYLKLQRLGWGNDPEFLALLYPSSYLPKLFFEDTTTSVCKASNLFILGLFICAFRRFKLDYLAMMYLAASMFAISLPAKANYSMDSMVRYNMPVFFVLTLILIREYQGESFSDLKKAFVQSFTKSKRLVIILGYLLSLAFQIWMMRVFTKGGWVA